MNITKKILSCVLALCAILALLATPSFAKTYDLRAAVTPKTMPDGTMIQMWGFADITPVTGSGIVTVPGPVLEVPALDTTLTINLTNNLSVPISIVIPGQVAALSPVYFGAGDPDYPGRMHSMTQETAPGATVQYTWTNLKPGTYLYQSGTQPQVQVQMGLYGAAKVLDASGAPYAGILVDAEFLFVYSEIDPAFHEAVSTGQYGPGTTMTSTINYKPKYFLINGEPYKAGRLFESIAAANQNVFIRFVNAGLQTHAPVLQDHYMKVLAENGNLYSYPKEQYEALLPAGSTADGLFVPDQNGIFALYDRMLSLTNADVSGGGMMVRFNVGAIQEAPSAANDIFSVNKNTALSVPAPGVLGNDGDSNGDPITAVIVQNVSNGTPISLNGDGSFNYTPNPGFTGTDTFTYTANDATGPSALATATINVLNRAPVAIAESYSVNQDTLLTVNAPGVLTNDSDPDSDPLTAVLQSNVTHGTLNLSANGSFTYTSNPTFTGTDTFTYMANDGTTSSAPVQVSITVNAVAPSITVTSPNGGETWVRGTQHTVTWNFTSNPGTTVSIVLLRNGSQYQTITNSAPIGAAGSGYYNWTIPSWLATGSAYRIRVRSNQNTSLLDTSNNNFTISAPFGTFTVTSPNGGETWTRGTPHTITWNYTGQPGTTVRIDLYRNGSWYRTIANSAPIGAAGSGSYNWNISTTIAVGSTYKIRVRSNQNTTLLDMSNNNFTIN